MFALWLAVVVAGGLLQVIGGVLTVRHARERWKSAGDGRTFLAYLLEPPRGWITAKIKRARHWWRQRRRPVSGSVTIQPATIQVEAVAVVAAVGSVTLLDGWPNAKDDPERFGELLRQKVLESSARIDQLRRELAARDQEIESKAQAELLAVKQSLDHVTDDIRASRLDGLRSDLFASVLVVVGVALATLGAIGLVFWA